MAPRSVSIMQHTSLSVSFSFKNTQIQTNANATTNTQSPLGRTLNTCSAFYHGTLIRYPETTAVRSPLGYVQSIIQTLLCGWL